MSNLKHAVMNMEIGKTKYDQTMKELLSDRQVLTWILKRFVSGHEWKTDRHVPESGSTV